MEVVFLSLYLECGPEQWWDEAALAEAAQLETLAKAHGFEAVSISGSCIVGGYYELLLSAVPYAIPAVGVVAVAWIKARAGRRVRVTIEGRSIEAGSVDEVERLLPQVLGAKVAKPRKQL